MTGWIALAVAAAGFVWIWPELHRYALVKRM